MSKEICHYRVQAGIRDLQAEFREFLHVVSHVRPTDYFDAAEAQRLAREIVADFKEVYDDAVA